jgi:hypothetical protein
MCTVLCRLLKNCERNRDRQGGIEAAPDATVVFMEKLSDAVSRNRVVWLATLCAAAAMIFTASLTSRAQTPVTVTVYKSASCGCCSAWVEHMKAAGFQMVTHDTEDFDGVKKKNRVPSELTSCHTALVGGYVIEGHVPADVVKRLLTEKPKILGLAVPGMPVGSPGMEVPGQGIPYAVLTFDQTSQYKVYDRR